MQDLPGATVLFLTGFLGHVLCLPLALFAAWCGGVLPLWAPVAFSAAMVAAEVVQPFGSGLLFLAVAMVALAYAFWRMDANVEPSGQAAT